MRYRLSTSAIRLARLIYLPCVFPIIDLINARESVHFLFISGQTVDSSPLSSGKFSRGAGAVVSHHQIELSAISSRGTPGMSSLLLGSEGDEDAEDMNESDDLMDDDDAILDQQSTSSSSRRMHGMGSDGGKMSGGSYMGGGGGRMGGRGGMKRSKDQKTTRVRTVLNEKQLHMLRTCYAANPRPDALMKEQLVEMTGLSPRVIRVWFQNKRCKDKKKQLMIKQMEQNHQVSI
ncbi:Insulin protein enhancer protein isl-1 [Cichlidogyrus casuarinus]|uniref:Insulin protein enhancer protein isl-1 n=1 Tax=Cichlidogyrus casuarinus TaxID=1844966 RepID=A0ABD2PZD7_9PLAT